jgi:DNA polymerase-3 subunit alpha
MAGMISGLQIRTSKRGNRFAQFRFEDRSGAIKGVLLGKNFDTLSSMLADDAMFIAQGNIESAEGQEPTLKITDLKSLDDALMGRSYAVNVTVPPGLAENGSMEELFHLMERDRGGCSVFLTMTAGDTVVKLEATSLSIEPSRTLQRELEDRGCSVSWFQ